MSRLVCASQDQTFVIDIIGFVLEIFLLHYYTVLYRSSWPFGIMLLFLLKSFCAWLRFCGRSNSFVPLDIFFGYVIINIYWIYRYLGILQEVVVFDCSKFDLILLLNCVVFLLVMNGFGWAIDEHIKVEVLTSVGHWSCLELNPSSIWYSNIYIAWYLQLFYSIFFFLYDGI